MSKQIKEMEMAALGQRLQSVRDLVFLSITGLSGTAENQARLGLRKKNIQMLRVKNSLTRLALEKLGVKLTAVWEGPTTLAWGSASLGELSRELDTLFKRNDKVKFKAALADGQQVPFEQALKMPTRQEALGRVVMLALAPASRLAGQLLGPASQLAGQIKGMKEREPAAEAEAAAPA
jgi:large subunit ribosomal protein L10